MASNINANNIDGTYPVAGVDNDSQGFRTNFTNIKNNLAYAKTELEDLQSKAILKSALTGTTLNNNLNGAVLSSAEIRDLRESEVDLGSASGTITLDHSLAHYYSVTTSGSISIGFSNLPTSGKVGRIRLKIILASAGHIVTLPASVTIGTNSIEGYSSNVITFAAAGTYMFEFITDDQGTNIHIQDLTRPRKTTATSTSWNGSTATFDRFTYASLSTNFNTSVTNRLIIDSGTTISIGNVYLPTPASDGQTVSISSNNAITTLRLISNTDAIIGNVASLSANTFVQYQYVDSANKWFRIG